MNVMVVLEIIIDGWALLLGALAVNGLAKWLGLANWYEFLAKPRGHSWYDYIWLFAGYPFALGLIIYAIVTYIFFD